MKIIEKKDYCVCKTTVELTSFDRFCIAQCAADLEDQCDAMPVINGAEPRIIIPKQIYDKVRTFFNKLAGKQLMENAYANVFAPEKPEKEEEDTPTVQL